MNCPDCGQQNPDDRSTCAGCGVALVDSDEPTIVIGGGSDDEPTFIDDPTEQPTVAGSGGAAPSGDGAALQPGQSLGERYEIQAILGTGGFGSVYRALDRQLARTVALKVIRPQLASNPEMLERFKREILLASKITHKNVVRIHDLGEVGDLKFISMAFIEGTDLSSVLKKEGPLTVERAVPIVVQVGEALQAAHDAGVVHRDLKPQNVLLDREGNAYIADFGISRSADHGETMTETGTVLGTLSYMSPEQARGETVDHRSDIYSLGLMLYQMFTGELPFKTANPLSSLMKRVHEDVPSIDLKCPGLPIWMTKIVKRAVARDLDSRYQSVAEMLQDIERQQASVVWGRKIRLRVAAAAVAVVILGALIFGGIRLSQRPPAAPAGPTASLVLLPFRNVSGDPEFDWVRTGLPDLLRSDLQQSQSLTLIPEVRVRNILEILKLDPTQELQPSALQLISKQTGVENLITAGLVRMGGSYRLDAHLLRVDASGVADDVPLKFEGEGDDALFTMIDDLGRGIRDELGVSKSRGARRASELTTDSIPALKLYNEGLGQAREGSDLEAVNRLEAAIRLDPDFSVARAQLAEAYGRLGETQKAIEAADAAAAGLRDASLYEQAWIRAVRARLAYDNEGALTAYQELTTLAPNQPESFFALALIQEEVGALEEAETSLSRVIELDPKNPSARFTLGRVRVKRGKLDEGLEAFNIALAFHTASGNEEGRATVLNGLGITHRQLGQPEQALGYYEQALEIRRQIGDRRGVGVALNNIAVVHKDMGRFAEAIEKQRECIEVYTELGDKDGLAGAYSTLGDIHGDAGHPDLALAEYKRGLALLREVGNEAVLAQTMGNIGYINAVLGDYDQAYFFQQSALEKWRKLGDRLSLMFTLIDIGFVEHVQGRYDKAIGYYVDGMELANEIRNTPGVVALSSNMSEVRIEQGEYAAAIALIEDAESKCRRADDPYLLVPTLKNLAKARSAIGNYDGAEAAVSEALEIVGELGNPALLAEVLTVRGDLQLARGAESPARATLDQAVAAAETSKDYRLLLLARLHRSRAGGSVADLLAVLKDAESTGLRPVAVRARLAIAQLHERQGRADEALREAERVIQEAGDPVQRDLLFEAHGLAAGLLQERSPEDSARHCARGLELLEQSRKGLAAEASGYFLSRPRTVAFVGRARKIFAASGHDADLQRLNGLSPP